MITEDYVSFETAKLLQEKGFDLEESPFYSEQDRDEWKRNAWYSVPNPCYDENIPFDSPTMYVTAPHVSLQMAMKWLRKRHNLHIEIRITNHSISSMVNVIKYYWVMCDTETGRWCDESTVYTVKAFDTPEEAEEDAIKHALENLTQKDSNPSI